MTSETRAKPRWFYDLVVVGATRAGVAVAHAARRRGARVAIVDHDPPARRHEALWGELRTRLLSLWSTMRHEGPSDGATLEAARAIFRDIASVEASLPDQGAVNGDEAIMVLPGPVRLLSDHELALSGGERLQCDRIVLATASRPRRPERFFGSCRSVTDPLSLLATETIPRSAVLVGADWTGCEWAFALACLGCPVMLVDRRARLLRSLDPEFRLAAQAGLHAMGVEIVLNEEINELREGVHGEVQLELGSGRREVADTLLVLAGETASVGGLCLEQAGIELDPNGQVIVDECGRTSLDSVLAIGAMVDASGLFASMDRHGETIAANALGEARPLETDLPWILNVHPQIGVCGLTVEAIQTLDLPHRIATHRQADSAAHGAMASLVADPGTGRILGAQVSGPGCVEAIHRAAEMLARDETVDQALATLYLAGTASECLVRASEHLAQQGDHASHPTQLGRIRATR